MHENLSYTSAETVTVPVVCTNEAAAISQVCEARFLVSVDRLPLQLHAEVVIATHIQYTTLSIMWLDFKRLGLYKSCIVVIITWPRWPVSGHSEIHWHFRRYFAWLQHFYPRCVTYVKQVFDSDIGTLQTSLQDVPNKQKFFNGDTMPATSYLPVM